MLPTLVLGIALNGNNNICTDGIHHINCGFFVFQTKTSAQNKEMLS
jgi:hypothetical protein